MTAEKKEDLPPWDGQFPSMEEMFLGNKEAIFFIETITRCSHLYDDLIDEDKKIEKDFVHQVMWEIMVGLPMNGFYRANATVLAPVIATGILNWRGANEMEALGNKEELYISHATRYSINDLALLCLVLVGGHKHAAQHARGARLVFQRDTIKHYLQEHDYGLRRQ
jgi:hypothetical protein